MRYVLLGSALMFVGAAGCSEPVEPQAPTVAETQSALDLYAESVADPITVNTLNSARIVEVGPCSGSVCAVRLASESGDEQVIRVQIDRERSPLTIENIAIVVE